jgi:hypothetical protein
LRFAPAGLRARLRQPILMPGINLIALPWSIAAASAALNP